MTRTEATDVYLQKSQPERLAFIEQMTHEPRSSVRMRADIMTDRQIADWCAKLAIEFIDSLASEEN